MANYRRLISYIYAYEGGTKGKNVGFAKIENRKDQCRIEANKRFFEKEEDVPRQAYTMGIKTIMRAKKILLIVSGADKADILYQSLCGPITPHVPASILQLHNDVTVVADEAALAKFAK